MAPWFQSSPVREGRALPSSPTASSLCRSFNPRPSAKDGRSSGSVFRRQCAAVSILARPRRTGAHPLAVVFGQILGVSILARPRRTGAPGRVALASASDTFQSSPVREGRALAPVMDSSPSSLAFQSSPVREGRALPARPASSPLHSCFNPRPSAKDGRSEERRLVGQPVLVSILARPRRTGAPRPASMPWSWSTSFNPRPSAKDGRSVFRGKRHTVVKVFQSSPVREGRALVGGDVVPHGGNVSILARPRRTGARH